MMGKLRMPPSGMFRLVGLVRTDVSVVRRLLVTANFPSSPILVTLMMETLLSSGTPVLIRATRRNMPEDDVHLILRPMVSRPVCPGVRPPSGTRYQFFFLSRHW
jgi:hypothetical protein